MQQDAKKSIISLDNKIYVKSSGQHQAKKYKIKKE